MGQHVSTEQSTNDSNVCFENGYVDIGIKRNVVFDVVHGLVELVVKAHHNKSV